MENKKLSAEQVEDLEFFTIEEINGIKQMHVHGYLYFGDNGIKSVECVGAYMELSEFAKLGNEERVIAIMSLCEESKQCIATFDGEDIVGVANKCYKGFKLIDIALINDDTPCGTYLMQYNEI
ncbi:MAG: hypothetical protein IKR66_06955 [Bacteroidales bacterium]|nr:hypothetical protein [Bacteroidales bacterium]